MFFKFAFIVLLGIVPTVTATASITGTSSRVPASISSGSLHHRHQPHYYQSSRINLMKQIAQQIEPTESETTMQYHHMKQMERNEFELEILKMELKDLKELVATIYQHTGDNSETTTETYHPHQINDAGFVSDSSPYASNSLSSRNLFSPSFTSMMAEIQDANNEMTTASSHGTTHCKKKKLDICLLIAGVPNALLCALIGVETAGTMCLANLITFGAAAAACVNANCDF